MKILQVNAVNGIRSTGRICSEFSEYASKYGMTCYTAYSEGMETENSYRISSKIECKCHAMLSRITGLQGYFSYFSTRNLVKYIEKIQPDIVHLHNLHSNYIHLKKLLKYLAAHDIATVVTLHDCWFYTGKCTHYTLEKCYKWERGCHACPKLKSDNKSWFFDRTGKMWLDKKKAFENIPRLAVIGVSEWLTKEAEKSFLSSADIVKRIYNWIDLSVFKPMEITEKRKSLGLEEKYIILGVASGWSEKKGLHTFLELTQYLKKDEILILVGNLPVNMLPDNILHINETDHVQELVEYYSMADVFLQLSLEETFGKVTAEALACGTPVITVDSTANAELIGDGCGIVLQGNDPAKVAEAIGIIRKTGKEFYQNACREFARKNFNVQERVEEQIELYNQLLK